MPGDFKIIGNKYRDALLLDVIPFWSKNAPDWEYGGYFASLNRKGEVFDKDKYAWPIGRQVWMYSTLYNKLKPKKEWLDIARLGATFLRDHGMDEEGKFFFAFDHQGNPLKKPSNIFSDCFATLGFAQFYQASGEEEYLKLAIQTYYKIEKRWANPKGIFNKETGIRPMHNVAKPMLEANMALELEGILSDDYLAALKKEAVNSLLYHHYDETLNMFFENVAPDGSHPDTYDGRLICPGHAIEAMWFVMDIAAQQNDIEAIERATDITLRMLEYGWDEEYGGIFYFLDFHQKPMQWKLEWDQKLWWVHLESLIALLKAFQHTGRKDVLEWFEKVHEYSWGKFPDPEFGEWFGYLNRQGEPLLTLKGSFKGCYHLPRALFECWKTLEKIQLQ